MNSDVTAVVPVWNRRDLLERMLQSLNAQTYPFAEILVVDNGSQDGAAELAEQRGARVIRMGSNTGFSKAVNRGIQECRTSWIAVLNSDVELAPDWLEGLRNAGQESGVWFAVGKILSAVQRDRIDGTYDAVCRGACAWRTGQGRRDGPVFASARTVGMASGTATLFRAEVFRRVGLYDETFESYLEDVDFSIRCASMGYTGRYVPEATAWHLGSATQGRWHPATVFLMARNQVLLVAKHYPAGLLLRYIWPIVVAQGLWGLVALRHGAGLAFLKGKLSGIGNFATVRRRPLKRSVLSSFLQESEREIYDIQRETGFDRYWTMYFLLTRGGAK